MEREKIKLTNSQWRDIIYENYLEINGNSIELKEIQDNYDDSRRHTECHHKILKRVIDNKFFKINYQSSVKDEMGWEECNYGNTEATEVFPKEEVIIIYN